MTTTTTSRRAILAGVAALPALGTAALAATAGDHPDAALFELERELAEALARQDEAEARLNERADESDRLKASWPLPAEPQPPAAFADLWPNVTGAQLAVLPSDHPLIVWLKETEAERCEHWDEKSRRFHHCLEQSGYNKAQTAFDEAVAEAHDVGLAMCDIPARTAAGILVKVNAVDALGLEDDHEDFWESICDDIRAMAGKAVHA
jgi:hypothetical protein